MRSIGGSRFLSSVVPLVGELEDVKRVSDRGEPSPYECSRAGESPVPTNGVHSAEAIKGKITDSSQEMGLSGALPT